MYPTEHLRLTNIRAGVNQCVWRTIEQIPDSKTWPLTSDETYATVFPFNLLQAHCLDIGVFCAMWPVAGPERKMAAVQNPANNCIVMAAGTFGREGKERQY